LLIGLTLLTGVFGLSLWGIKTEITKEMRASIVEQVKEPRIRELIVSVVSTQSEQLLRNEVKPTVESFKRDVGEQLQAVTGLAASVKQDISTTRSNLDVAEAQIGAIVKRLAAEDARAAQEQRARETADVAMHVPPQVDFWLEGRQLNVLITNGIPIKCTWQATKGQGPTGELIGGISLSQWKAVMAPKYEHQVFKESVLPSNYDPKDELFNVTVTYESAYVGQIGGAPNLSGSIHKVFRWHDGNCEQVKEASAFNISH